ncbi:MAG TPA: AbrB/MazE/SpoVT family DNA-binding domain-containing protein [Myxococcales bacterium]|jgi:bifunctional DNA-binding transcriptional regulator/antitoxin component of YhaV-PrlF toxin-antitoxin module
MDEAKTRLTAGGRLVLPARFRRALGLKVGDEVVLCLSGREVRMMAPREAVRRAQELVRRHVPRGTALSQELLRDRRAETRSE